MNRWDINAIPLNIANNFADLDTIRRAAQNYKPYTQFGSVYHYSNYGHNSFHSATMKFEKRFSHGLEFNSFYTRSKAIDEASGEGAASGITVYNRSLEKARSDYDVTNRWITYAVYQLPIGRGRRLLSNSRGVVNAILGNWNLNMIQTLEQGAPFSFSSTGTSNVYLPGALRPDMAPGKTYQDIKLQWDRRGPCRHIVACALPSADINAFAYPQSFTPGQAGRNIQTGPGILWHEVSGSKEFLIRGRVRATVRLDVNNPFKRPYFVAPNSAVNFRNPQAFGKITGVNGMTAGLGAPKFFMEMHIKLEFLSGHRPLACPARKRGENQMQRRKFLATMSASLGALHDRIDAATPAGERNIRWAVSMFLWTSTQWKDDGSARFTDMLDVIKDTGFDGFRLTGWPKSLETYNMPVPVLEKELAKRGLGLATMSFGGQADDAAKHGEIEASAREACKLLKHFGADVLTVFSPRRVNKVLEREHIRRACEFWNRLGDVCGEYGVRAGLHNHSQGQLIESQDEVELMLKLTDPKRFHWSPDTIHLYMAGCDIVGLFEKYARRLISMDLVDAKYVYATQDLHVPNGRVEKAGTQNATFMLCNQDYGDGEVDLPALMRILGKIRYKGWITIDHHYAPVSPRHSFTRCMKYIREKLAPIYA